MAKTEKKYTSLGQMAKAGDFVALTEKIKELKDDDSFKLLVEKTSSKPISQLDDLLFQSFNFCKVKKEEDDDAEDDEENKRSSFEPDNEPYVFKEGFIDFLKIAIANGANPNTKIKSGITAFLKSCECNNTEALEALIESTDVNIHNGDGHGYKALHYAVMNDADIMIDFLVKEKGLDINEKNILSNNQTVFHVACANIKVKAIDKLMELGIDPTILDGDKGLAGDAIPSFDPADEDFEDYNEKDGEIWDQAYEKVKAYYTQFVEKKEQQPQKKYKTSF